jgi:hypothetical protein
MRDKGNAFACLWKHLILVNQHIEETLTKLSGECPEGTSKPTCIVSKATREECHKIVQNTMAAEEHLAEILPQLEQHHLQNLVSFCNKMLNTIRVYRQNIVQTGIAFRESNKPVPSTITQILKQYSLVLDKYLRAIEQYSDQMSQELSEICSERCAEDTFGRSTITPQKLLNRHMEDDDSDFVA